LRGYNIQIVESEAISVRRNIARGSRIGLSRGSPSAASLCDGPPSCLAPGFAGGIGAPACATGWAASSRASAVVRSWDPSITIVRLLYFMPADDLLLVSGLSAPTFRPTPALTVQASKEWPRSKRTDCIRRISACRLCRPIRTCPLTSGEQFFTCCK
jgi:hypothetical protein